VTKKVNHTTSEVKTHSEFGGSKSKQILNCPGSVVLSRGIPNKSNAAADKGTNAHSCVEFFIRNHKMLKKKVTRDVCINIARNTEEWDESMIENALDTLTWLKEQVSPNTSVYVESKVDSSAFTTEGQGSTLDIAVANWSARELIIADFKNGKHPVEVEENSQLIYYALGMLIKLKGFKKFDRVRCVIIQPNAYHKNGTIREWYISVDDAIKWGKKFRKTVKIALKPNAPLKYGEWCFFCLANKICPVIRERKASRDFK